MLTRILPISDELKQAIVRHSEIRSFKKKELMLKRGKVCQYSWFVVKGLVRAYCVKDDKEITSWFMSENDIIFVRSFFTQQPSEEYIQALEETTCICLDHEGLQQIYATYMEFNFIGRKLMESYYLQSEERAFSLRFHHAQERYQQLLVSQPDIINRVFLGYIASYLGISQSTLSRIRAMSARHSSFKRYFEQGT